MGVHAVVACLHAFTYIYALVCFPSFFLFDAIKKKEHLQYTVHVIGFIKYNLKRPLQYMEILKLNICLKTLPTLLRFQKVGSLDILDISATSPLLNTCHRSSLPIKSHPVTCAVHAFSNSISA